MLSQKFDDWVSTITDKTTKDLVRKNTIITGGCIASMLLGEPVNDFDVYFTDLETTRQVALYYAQQFPAATVVVGNLPGQDNPLITPDRVRIYIKSAGVVGEPGYSNPDDETEVKPEKTDDKDKPRYRPVFLSSNAITLSNQVQIVIRFHGDPKTIHQHYDYLHCTNYWLSQDRTLYLNQPALEALLAKELIYVGSKYPICSVIRLRKFIKRGWTINAGQVLKMAYQISKLNLDDLNVLEDQLTGVDATYFSMMVESLKAHSEKHPDFRLSYGYLCSIVDKLFS